MARWVSAKAFGDLGEQATRIGGQPARKDIGQGRHGERREHEPQGDALLPRVDAEARLRADGDPGPVILADATSTTRREVYSAPSRSMRSRRMRKTRRSEKGLRSPAMTMVSIEIADQWAYA